MDHGPMQRAFETLRDTWLQATQEPDRRLLVWRVPANAARLLAAFLELQRSAGGRQTSDFFLRLTSPYVLGFTYSRALLAAVHQGQKAYEKAATAEGEEVRAGWQAPPGYDSPHGVMTALQSLAQHHGERLRFLAAVVEPESCVEGDGLECWVDAALAEDGWPDVRLVLVDTIESPVWQRILERHKEKSALLAPPVDMFTLTRDVAVQSPGTGPGVVYRQLLADVVLLVQRGSAQDVALRAERALAVATRQGWHGQVATLRLMQAGAWLKHGEAARASELYRQVRNAAPGPAGAGAGATAPPHLVMQSWFGEAGCWLCLDQPRQAVPVYRQAAQAAAALPSPVLGMEAQRMVGWCLLRAGEREAARRELLDAVQLSIPLSLAERRMTTLPQTLWDLLVLQDRRRCDELKAVGESSLKHVAGLFRQADAEGRALGARPTREALDAIERTLDKALDKATARARRRREILIRAGDAFFRSIVDAARRLLDPAWDGLPALEPPSADATAGWSDAPALLGLTLPGPTQGVVPHATGALP